MFLAMIKEAGFDSVRILGQTDFDSSPVTQGAMIRAVKPESVPATAGSGAMGDLLDKYQEFFNEAYQDGALDSKTKIMISLGASLGSGCEP
jgi:alkylhydroperoxidase/carboxymuconolactone decarboxylase family protein YurZ